MDFGQNNMAGIRQVHLINGVALSILKTPLVKQLLEGQNINALARRLNKNEMVNLEHHRLSIGLPSPKDDFG